MKSKQMRGTGQGIHNFSSEISNTYTHVGT